MDNPKQKSIQAVWAVLIIVAWMATDYVFHFVNYASASAVTGGGFQLNNLNPAAFLGDGEAWGGFLPRWFSLCVPSLVILGLELRRIRFTWRVALLSGLSIVVLQWLAWIAACLFRTHEPIFSAGLLFYLSRLWIVLPGPMVAYAVTKLDFSESIQEA